MKVSHESPLSLLSLSRKYNDYDYALVHLFEEIPEYLEFFKKSIEMGRHVILDNSIFELGKSFNPDRFAHWIEQLNPTEYIIPDVLEDISGTLNQFYNWINKYRNLPGNKIGVLQGKTYDEIVHCYRSMEPYCDKIAISFDYSYYQRFSSTDNKYGDWCRGRITLVKRLLDDGVIDINKPHHLLGASLPQEFEWYSISKCDFIETIDTSNPIVHGLYNIRYDDQGLRDKLSIKLVDLIYSVPDIDQIQSIYYNIDKFKQFIQS